MEIEKKSGVKEKDFYYFEQPQRKDLDLCFFQYHPQQTTKQTFPNIIFRKDRINMAGDISGRQSLTQPVIVHLGVGFPSLKLCPSPPLSRGETCMSSKIYDEEK